MISFYHDEDVIMPKLRRNILKQWIREVASIKGKNIGNITYNFCSDETILKANNQFLKHDYYTDIITFDECIEDTLNGDLLISIDTVTSNAELLGVEFEQELHRVIIHGVLHLIGLGDKVEEEARLMRKNEDEALFILRGIVGENHSLLRK